MNKLPLAESVPKSVDIEKIKHLISKKNYGSLANNTKWNELIHEIRAMNDWKPSYRSKSVTGYVSDWDTEWFYHLPFPFLCVEWFDISLQSNESTPDDYVVWLEGIVSAIGFEFEIKNDILRIWGYGPKSYDQF